MNIPPPSLVLGDVVSRLCWGLLLGSAIGFERQWHQKMAGLKTNALVALGSAGFVTFATAAGQGNPSQVSGQIVSGIGFLGAGVIMKEGFNISGLTTAASIWAVSVIGVTVGLGFYAAGILLAVISTLFMLWGSRLEQWLPSRPALAITMRFREGFHPHEKVLRRVAKDRGYDLASGTLSINNEQGRAEWRFVAIRQSKDIGETLSAIAEELEGFEGVESFSISHARN